MYWFPNFTVSKKYHCIYMGYGFEILINQFPQINTTHTERLIKMYYIAFCYLLFSTTKTVSKSIIFDDFYSFRIGTRHGSVFNSGQFTNQTRERWFFLVPVNVVAFRWRVLSSPSSRMPAWLLEIQPSCVKVKTKIASEKIFRNFWEWNQKKSEQKTATIPFYLVPQESKKLNQQLGSCRHNRL